MKAEIIDFNDYIYSGEGANGESYDHKVDHEIMVKLYNQSMDVKLIEDECEIARKVYEAGIPSPEPGSFITDGHGRYGIRFRRLVDKVSFARAVGNEPEKVEMYARRFGQACKQLHSTRVSRDAFPNVKDQYLTMLESNPYYSPEEKEQLRSIIVNTPDADTAIHGDLSFGNILDVAGKDYFIDLGEFAYGHPYFDLGMVLVTCIYDDAEFVGTAFHMTLKSAAEFWDYFVDEYFDGKLTPKEAIELIRPYAAVKNLLMERNAKMKLEMFHSLLNPAE